jgi:hypothetical protein
MIDKFVENYRPGENLVKPDEELLEFGKKMLPPEILYLWENYGFGEYGDGFIKVVDPRDYMGNLYTWLGAQDFNKIPIIVSAFGDIFYYRKLENNENDISILDIHYRKIEVCTYSYEEFFEKYIIDSTIKENVLREKLYNEAINTLGNLQYNEIFFFVPALVLGGKEDIKYIKKGDANVHQQVLFELGNK